VSILLKKHLESENTKFLVHLINTFAGTGAMLSSCLIYWLSGKLKTFPCIPL